MAAAEIIDLAFKRHADEIRASWQFRLLKRSVVVDSGAARPRSEIGMCVISILHHNFDDAMPVLLTLAGAVGWGAPYLVSAAKIAKTGHVMADFVSRAGIKHKNQGLFVDTKAMETAFRRLADRAHLNDKEREEFFAALKRWVVCDYRIDPTMNPDDPDSRRLVAH